VEVSTVVTFETSALYKIVPLFWKKRQKRKDLGNLMNVKSVATSIQTSYLKIQVTTWAITK
jgi:uncharacterized membrane protein